MAESCRSSAGIWRAAYVHSSRSTTWAWPADVNHASLHDPDSWVLDTGLSRAFSELFDGPHL